MKAIMLQAIPKTYTSALAHPQLGYASTTPQAIMTHLLTRYGAIQEKDLAENMALLKAPWNPDAPIEMVFDNGTFCRDYATSIKTIHVKDCNPQVRTQGAAAEWDYATFSKNAIWTELGQGCVDFPAIFATLATASFTGWIIVETDVTQLASPLQSAQVSREYLRGLGL